MYSGSILTIFRLQLACLMVIPGCNPSQIKGVHHPAALAFTPTNRVNNTAPLIKSRE